MLGSVHRRSSQEANYWSEEHFLPWMGELSTKLVFLHSHLPSAPADICRT